MKNQANFLLLLCTKDIELIKLVQDTDIDSIIVEWERIDESDHNPIDEQLIKSEWGETFQKVRANTNKHLICRLNPNHLHRNLELETAISLGADEIWLPKITTIEEVENALDLINNRCQLGIVIETVEAVKLAPKFNQLPLSHVHIGLNDLRDALRKPHSFYALIDGTVENILKNLNIPYGFGGLTLPEKGSPIPCQLLMGELIRLKCKFSLLRRSFIADTVGKNLKTEVEKIGQALNQKSLRNQEQIRSDHQKFTELVKKLLHEGEN